MRKKLLYLKNLKIRFFYKSPTNTNTSFYFVTSSLETKKLEQFRKYVWNKNDADTIAYKGWNNVMRLPGLLANKYSGDVKYLYILNHPQQYKDSLLSYLQNPVYSWEHKYYMLGLLQGMPVSEYSPVLSAVYDVVKNQIKENITDTFNM